MKICQVIFSTNRIEYLKRTLAAQRNLNWEGFTVDRIFIDDYPRGRDDLFLTELVRTYGYNEVHLHQTNLGLSVTWTEFWNLIRDRDYDYVWHQEDDVEILEPIRVMDLVALLQQDPGLSQIVLKRQKWYFNESDSRALDTDWTYLNYRYEKTSLIFSPMASLYSTERVHFPYSDWYKQYYPGTNFSEINLNEGMVGKALAEGFGLVSGHLKASTGANLVNHIGEYFVGKRVLPNEPSYEQFSRYDPDKKYDSKTGADWE
jgi:hypothetical protein